MEESIVEVLEAFCGLIVDGRQVQKGGERSGTRGEVEVNWDVEIIIREEEAGGN